LAASSSNFRFEFEDFDWRGDYYYPHGVKLPENGLDALGDKDAILFGSVGDHQAYAGRRAGMDEDDVDDSPINGRQDRSPLYPENLQGNRFRPGQTVSPECNDEWSCLLCWASTHAGIARAGVAN